jgi:hypothetical protein
MDHRELIGIADFTCVGEMDHSELVGNVDFTCSASFIFKNGAIGYITFALKSIFRVGY